MLFHRKYFKRNWRLGGTEIGKWRRGRNPLLVSECGFNLRTYGGGIFTRAFSVRSRGLSVNRRKCNTGRGGEGGGENLRSLRYVRHIYLLLSGKFPAFIPNESELKFEIKFREKSYANWIKSIRLKFQKRYIENINLEIFSRKRNLLPNSSSARI